MITAFVLAVGGAFASHYHSLSFAYEWDNIAIECIPHEVEGCSPEGSEPCTISGVPTTLRENSNVSTMCGKELARE